MPDKLISGTLHEALTLYAKHIERDGERLPAGELKPYQRLRLRLVTRLMEIHADIPLHRLDFDWCSEAFAHWRNRPAADGVRYSVRYAVITLPAGFRIKTVKLRGQVSQGICLPLSVLPPDAPTDEGADVTDLLGVRKWEPPLPVGMGGRVKGPFPGFLPKTDETRVQVLEPVLSRHRGKTFHVTEKLDGTSFTGFVRGGGFGVCSRNLWMDESDESNVLVRVARGLRLEERLRSARGRLGHDVAVQAEVIGPGVQKNKYGLREVTLRVFGVLNVDAYRLLDHPDQLAAVAGMGLESVPQLGTLVLDHSVDELVALAEGASALSPRAQREGVVLRPPVEEYDEDVGGRLSFKAINPRFLLKYDE